MGFALLALEACPLHQPVTALSHTEEYDNCPPAEDRDVAGTALDARYRRYADRQQHQTPDLNHIQRSQKCVKRCVGLQGFKKEPIFVGAKFLMLKDSGAIPAKITTHPSKGLMTSPAAANRATRQECFRILPCLEAKVDRANQTSDKRNTNRE